MSNIHLTDASPAPWLADEHPQEECGVIGLFTPEEDAARLTFFGMGGNSSNRFDAKDSTEWEFDKDSQKIDYTAKVVSRVLGKGAF